jgi:hypothetical protein
MKILYVPNEWGAARQSGMRRALATLLDHGLVEDVRVYSLLWRLREGGGKEAAFGLLDLAREYEPDVVLMQHLGGTGLDFEFFQAFRAGGSFRLIYHEADPYSRWKHRLPPEAQAAGRYADVVYTVGKGVFRDNFTRSGSADVRWCSSVFDPGRFGRSTIPDVDRPFDIVMIANRSTARTPFTGHPNSRQREQLVRLLQRRYGERFAIFGKGWDGPSAKGPIDYSKQNAAIHSGWISANWDHYANEPAYFSDRLPTTLATGSVHVTTQHPGFEEIFPESNPFIKFGASPKEIVSVIEEILCALDPDQALAAALEGQRFAHGNFRQDDQLVSMLNFSQVIVDPVRASTFWNDQSRMITEV